MLASTSTATLVQMAETTANMISSLELKSIFPFLVVVALVVIFGRWRARKSSLSGKTTLSWQKPQTPSEKKVSKDIENVLGLAYTEVTPLEDFEWSSTEPLALRTFKPQYHITMGIERLPISDWIQIDRHYLSRINTRRSIINSNRGQVLRALPSTHRIVRQLYRFMVDFYLPIRFPQMFQKVSQAYESTEQSHLVNRVTGDKMPLQPFTTAESLLETLGRQIEEDFLILQPDESSGEFMLGAYMACFPNGFDWEKKLGKSMSEIHVPVPDYETKLKKSMNRYLSRIEPGQTVKRHNWSISTTGNLFSPTNVHLYKGETIQEEEVDFDKACLRCERQVLHRLMDSDDLILTIRTYMYLLKDIRGEGSGPDLAAAIDGLQTGSSPGMYFYKRAPNWTRAVKEYLLAEERKTVII